MENIMQALNPFHVDCTGLKGNIRNQCLQEQFIKGLYCATIFIFVVLFILFLLWCGEQRAKRKHRSLNNEGKLITRLIEYDINHK